MMEIITGVERRRRWSLEEKLRIVAETEQLGIGIAEIARRYEISQGLLWNWRSQVRRGVLRPEPPPVFLPSKRLPASPTSRSRLTRSPAASPCRKAPLSRARLRLAVATSRISVSRKASSTTCCLTRMRACRWSVVRQQLRHVPDATPRADRRREPPCLVETSRCTAQTNATQPRLRRSKCRERSRHGTVDDSE